MNRILIIAEHDGKTLNPGIAKCVSCAMQFTGYETDIAVLADHAADICRQAAGLQGVSRILQVERPENAQALAAVFAPQIVALAAGYSHVLGPSTTFGKDLMPRVAALLGTSQVSDIMSVSGPYEFKRPVYAGDVIQTVKAAQDSKLVATVRIASFSPCQTGGSASVESVAADAVLPTHTRYVELRAQASDRPDLQAASRVVAGGRALGSAEKFKLIYDFADKIGAAVGASRAAVDAGYVSNDAQVGQTGRIVAPDVYFAIGISGAIQHVTGIKDAGTIVAINKDPEAPIFEIADIGLVGDLFAIIPELQSKLG